MRWVHCTARHATALLLLLLLAWLRATERGRRPCLAGCVQAVGALGGGADGMEVDGAKRTLYVGTHALSHRRDHMEVRLLRLLLWLLLLFLLLLLRLLWLLRLLLWLLLLRLLRLLLRLLRLLLHLLRLLLRLLRLLLRLLRLLLRLLLLLPAGSAAVPAAALALPRLPSDPLHRWALLQRAWLCQPLCRRLAGEAA